MTSVAPLFAAWIRSLFGGVSIALAICIAGYFLSWNVGRKIDAAFAQSNEQSSGQNNVDRRGIVKVHAMTLTRLAISLGGVIGVFLIFGNSWGIPCALSVIPFYIIELACVVWRHLYQRRPPRVMQSESK